MSLKRDILTTGLVKVLRRIVLGFASTLILTRWLGPEQLGLYTAIMVVPMILASLGELGIRQSAAYLTGKKLATEIQVAGALVSLWLVTSVFSVVLVSVSYYMQGMHKEGFLCVLVGIALAPASLIVKYANGIALGKQWISRLNIGETATAVTRLALLAVFLMGTHGGVLSALIIEVIATLLPAVLMLYWLRKDIGIRLIPLWDGQLAYSLVGHGFKFAMGLFVLSLNYRINVLILQRFVDNSDIGQFSLGIKIAEMIWLIPGAVGMVLFSHSTSAADSMHFARTTSQVMRLTLVVCGFGALLLGVLCRPFISIVFGSQYLPSVPVIQALLPGCLAACVFKVLNADLAGRGYPLAAMGVYLGALCLNVLSSLMLIPLYGVVGSSMASSISHIAAAAVYALVYAHMSHMSLLTVFYQPRDDWETMRTTVARFLEALRSGRQYVGSR